MWYPFAKLSRKNDSQFSYWPNRPPPHSYLVNVSHSPSKCRYTTFLNEIGESMPNNISLLNGDCSSYPNLMLKKVHKTFDEVRQCPNQL